MSTWPTHKARRLNRRGRRARALDSIRTHTRLLERQADRPRPRKRTERKSR